MEHKNHQIYTATIHFHVNAYKKYICHARYYSFKMRLDWHIFDEIDGSLVAMITVNEPFKIFS